ncbi:hypothetical protein H5410_007065 [Solanum commersonii]|uniref:Uncharacterized protein n=1 Tax=Solanum commersonii TaxID=4109 RepID=A0A9J6AD35_SOLCO|nr:hypothetical protein H5410_007065 [Solanum commersonii]
MRLIEDESREEEIEGYKSSDTDTNENHPIEEDDMKEYYSKNQFPFQSDSKTQLPELFDSSWLPQFEYSLDPVTNKHPPAPVVELPDVEVEDNIPGHTEFMDTVSPDENDHKRSQWHLQNIDILYPLQNLLL